jgi:hypothetical protein
VSSRKPGSLYHTSRPSPPLLDITLWHGDAAPPVAARGLRPAHLDSRRPLAHRLAASRVCVLLACVVLSCLRVPGDEVTSGRWGWSPQPANGRKRSLVNCAPTCFVTTSDDSSRHRTHLTRTRAPPPCFARALLCLRVATAEMQRPPPTTILLFQFHHHQCHPSTSSMKLPTALAAWSRGACPILHLHPPLLATRDCVIGKAPKTTRGDHASQGRDGQEELRSRYCYRPPCRPEPGQSFLTSSR